MRQAADERAGQSTSAGIARGPIAEELTGGDVTGDKTPGGGTGEADRPAAGPLGGRVNAAGGREGGSGAAAAGTGDVPGGGVVDGDVTDLMGDTDTSTGTGPGRALEQ
jgi:hypothetical protein